MTSKFGVSLILVVRCSGGGVFHAPYENWLMWSKWWFPLMGCLGQNAPEVPSLDDWGILPQAPDLSSDTT